MPEGTINIFIIYADRPFWDLTAQCIIQIFHYRETLFFIKHMALLQTNPIQMHLDRK